MSAVMELPETVEHEAWTRLAVMQQRVSVALSDEVRSAFDLLAGRGPYLQYGVLVRDRDESGVSGVGDVAYVLHARFGLVLLAWPRCGGIEAFPDLAAVLECHGHNGKTYVLWSDGSTRGKGGVS